MPGDCRIRGCKAPVGLAPAFCYNERCEHSIHFTCFKAKIIDKYNLQFLPDPEIMEDGPSQYVVACTKACYDKVLRRIEELKKRKEDGASLLWDKDGREGPDDPNNSLNALIKWLAVPGNYSNYRGGEANIKKTHYQEEIARKINASGVLSKRTAKQVGSKIAHVEKQWKEAHDWTFTETGAGLKENDPGTFKDSILRKCPYYFDLYDVMADRASARPKMTSDDLDRMDGESVFNSSDDEESEKEHDDVQVVGQSISEDTVGGSVCGSTGTDEDIEVVGGIVGGSNSIGAHDGNVAALSNKSTNGGLNEQSAKKRRGGRSKPLSVASTKRAKPTKKTTKKSKFEGDDTNAWLQDMHTSRANRLQETTRHHMALESIERQKAGLPENSVWQVKSSELQYKFELIAKYESIKKEHSWMNDEMIKKMFPDMATFIDMKNSSSTDDHSQT